MINIYFNQQRIVCTPYGVKQLHAMASRYGVPRKYFIDGKRPYYEMPTYKLKEFIEFSNQQHSHVHHSTVVEMLQHITNVKNIA